MSGELSAEEIVDTLRSHRQPVFVLNRPSILMLGVERYLPQMFSIQLHASWGQRDERTFIASNAPKHQLSHTESANWLLRDAQVHEFISRHTPAGITPAIITFLADETTERLCAELGYQLMANPASMRHHLDSKIVTTQLSEQAGLTNVPHTIVHAASAAELFDEAQRAGLGRSLVLQTAYGEGGSGTYFVESVSDIAALGEVVLHTDVKCMKRIRHEALAMEAVILPDAQIVTGPLLREIVGHAAVAIHRGSSSGLEFSPQLVSEQLVVQARDMVVRYGRELAQLGYLGIFEVDLLHDLDTGALYLGESNPRMSGCAMVSNAVTAQAWGFALYALQVLAFSEHPPRVDTESLNTQLCALPGDVEWSNILVRHLDARPQVVIEAPITGRYRVKAEGDATFDEVDRDWFSLRGPSELFEMSYRRPGDVLVRGDDIGTIVLRSLAQSPDGELTPAAQHFVRTFLSQYETRSIGLAERIVKSVSRRLRRNTLG